MACIVNPPDVHKAAPSRNDASLTRPLISHAMSRDSASCYQKQQIIVIIVLFFQFFCRFMSKQGQRRTLIRTSE